MARIRSVHPGLFTDEAFVSCSHAARLLFIGLWTEADDGGVFEWKPITIKMRLMSADEGIAVPLLAELEAANMVKRYTVAGRDYGAVRNFCRFQRPKKPKSIHPMPAEFRTYVASEAASTEPDDDEGGSSSPPAPHQPSPVPPKSKPPSPQPPSVPQKSRNSPQMEDGGDKKEESCPEPAMPDRAQKPYPSDFEEEFWPLYPTSANMSKKKAAAVWAKLSAEDRRKAVAAIPGFLAHCRKNPTYQPVYADRFLNERRFDGYVEAAAGGQKPAEPRVDFGGGVSASEPMVVDFLKRGEWLDQWGPRHGQPGCRVPERLIEAAGCADQRGVA